MPKLTKAVIDNHSPKEKNYFIWDTEIKGFGCQILKGGKKTYAFYYHSPLEKKKAYIKIGCHGNITVDLARSKAKTLSAAVASGLDPRQEKKEQLMTEKQSVLFRDFFNIFKEKHIEATYKREGIPKNLSLIRLYILPYFGKKRLGEISTKDIRQFMDSLSRIPGSANNCLSLVSMVFRKAEEWEYMPPRSNPCTGVRKYKERKKQRFLSDEELQRLECVLSELEQKSQETANSVHAIRLLMYIGCRKNEVLRLKWENVHLKDRYIYLSDSKTGESARPLNQKAIDLLASLTPKEGNPYVFYGRIPGRPIRDLDGTWVPALKRAGITGFRLHDLRHSFASFALKKGVDLYTVSKLLGHKSIATTTRYAHLELSHLKDATDKMAEVFG